MAVYAGDALDNCPEGDEALVACIDGPLAGQWFTWKDWQARIAAARWVAERSGRRSPSLSYQPAGYRIEHTRWTGRWAWAATCSGPGDR